MKITRESSLSGETNTMELNITPVQITQYAMGNTLIQDVFPNLTPGEREFIKTGITVEEFAAMTGAKKK